MEIKVEHQPTQVELEHLDVYKWPIWMKEPSKFPAIYEVSEMCYFLEGEVFVIPEGGEPVRIVGGDLVTFPAGLSCTWDVKSDIKKHYCYAAQIARQSEQELQDLGIFDYPIWKKEVSEFKQTYSADKLCYFLEGEVVVNPIWGEPIHIHKGDLVTFHAGISSNWQIKSDVKMHYCYPE